MLEFHTLNFRNAVNDHKMFFFQIFEDFLIPKLSYETSYMSERDKIKLDEPSW